MIIPVIILSSVITVISDVYKRQSVTHQLCEGSANAQQAYLHAVILSAAVDKQCDGIENDAGETDAAVSYTHLW